MRIEIPKRGIVICTCQTVLSRVGEWDIHCGCVAQMDWVGAPPDAWTCGDCLGGIHVSPKQL